MTWRKIAIPDVASQYNYEGCRIREVITEEFIMHGGAETTKLVSIEYEVWEDKEN